MNSLTKTRKCGCQYYSVFFDNHGNGSVKADLKKDNGTVQKKSSRKEERILDMQYEGLGDRYRYDRLAAVRLYQDDSITFHIIHRIK